MTTATIHSRSTRIAVKDANNKASPEPDDSYQNLTENIGTKIRREELELMQLEETRRYLVIQEKLSSYGSQYNDSQRSPRKTVSQSVPAPKTPQYNPFQGSGQYQSVSLSPEPSLTRSKSQMTPNKTSQSANFLPFQTPEFSRQSSLNRQMSSIAINVSSVPGSPVVTSKNFDAIISWLAFPRYASLKDRHTKQEYIIVIDSEINDKNQELFVLKWYEINPRDRNATSGPILDDRSVLKGYVYLQDITNIQLSGKNQKESSNLLILQLSSIARALKNSGGRTVLCFEFTSESESSKYFQGIQTLQSYKRQQMNGKSGQ